MMDEDPKIWGPDFWRVMRKIAERYPVSNPSQSVQVAAKAFFESLTELLPCHKCRSHYTELIAKFPVNYSDRSSLMAWVETIRHEVDKTLPPRDKTVKSPPSVPPPHSAANYRRMVPTKSLPNQRAFPPGRSNVLKAPTPNLSSTAGAPLYPSASVKAVQLQRLQAQRAAATPAATKYQLPNQPKKSGCSSCAKRK